MQMPCETAVHGINFEFCNRNNKSKLSARRFAFLGRSRGRISCFSYYIKGKMGIVTTVFKTKSGSYCRNFQQITRITHFISELVAICLHMLRCEITFAFNLKVLPLTLIFNCLVQTFQQHIDFLITSNISPQFIVHQIYTRILSKIPLHEFVYYLVLEKEMKYDAKAYFIFTIYFRRYLLL